jgi:poly(3-hydroxybutyrate) depolymerase
MTISANAGRAALALAAVVLATTPGCSAEDRADLPSLAADISQTSVSGISSGAYMAGQFHLAHSKLVTGAAIIAGGPYGCAESVFADVMPGPGVAILNLSKAINGCMLNTLAVWGTPDPELLAERTRKLAEAGKIDSLEDLKGDRIYLFSGENDRTVMPAIVAAASEYYRLLGVPADHITYVSNLPAGHAFVTESEGLACEATGKPYVVDCDYDQAGEVLKAIYGHLAPRADKPAGTFLEFDQEPFFDRIANHGMEERGVVYLPPACTDGKVTCRVHIAFHGCAQNRANTGEAFIKGSGYANWADANALVILFPQAETSPMNPQGCWDWWGYTSRDYLTRKAPQIEIIHRLLVRLGQPRT